MLSDFITECLHKVARNEGFKKGFYNITTTAGSKHGDNLLGVVTAITVSGLREQNGISTKEALCLICKAPPLSEIRKKNWKSKLVFDREIYVYSKLLPAFVQFQQDKGLSEADSFLAFPKVYACNVDEENDTYILIMEDLRVKNFVMWPKDELISLDHELLVLRELAKFHAISFAMKDQRPNEFDEFKQLRDVSFEVIINGSLKTCFCEIIERSIDCLDNFEHKKLMKQFRKTFIKKMEHLLLGPPSTELAVIRHGDCWNNNFLFQYSEDDSLKGINFVDWQLSHYCSPAVDVLYNIFTSTDKEFRDQNYDTLLNTYYTSLSESIQRLGSDPNKLYSFEQFQAQLKKFSEYALLYCPVILSLRLAQEKGVTDLDEYAERLENGEDVDLLHQFDAETQKRFSKLINGAVTDLVNYGYIN